MTLSTEIASTRRSPGLVAIDEQRRVAFRIGAERRIVLAERGTLRALTGDLGEAAIVGATRLAASDTLAWTTGGTLVRSRGDTATLLGRRIPEPLGLGFGSTGAPGVNDAGEAVVVMNRETLYLLAGRRARPLVRIGDEVEGASPIAALGEHRGNTDGSISVLADLEDGRAAVLVRSGNTLRRLIADGDPGPSGGTIEVTALPPHDVGDRHVAMLLDTPAPDGGTSHVLYEQTSGGAFHAVVGEGDPSPTGTPFTTIGAPLALRQGTVFVASLYNRVAGSWMSGVFFARRGRIVPIALSGDVVPGSSQTHVTDVYSPTSSAGGIVFPASLDDPTDPAAFLTWRPGRSLGRLDRTRGAASIGVFVWAAPFVVGIDRGEDGLGSLVALRRHGSRTLADDGDTAPLGSAFVIGDGLARTRRGVAFTALRTIDLRPFAILEASLPGG